MGTLKRLGQSKITEKEFISEADTIEEAEKKIHELMDNAGYESKYSKRMDTLEGFPTRQWLVTRESVAEVSKTETCVITAQTEQEAMTLAESEEDWIDEYDGTDEADWEESHTYAELLHDEVM